MSKPLLAITLGDAAGIGPEVAAKTLSEANVYTLCRPLVIGTGWVMEDGVRVAGRKLQVRVITWPEDARGELGTIDVLDQENLRRDEVQIGRVTAGAGRASVQWIEEAARLAIAGQIEGIVTCPINKEAVHAAGYDKDIGHQEILSRMTGATGVGTMLIAGKLRVPHLSTHKPLSVACAYVRKANILERLELTHRCLEGWGLAKPRIAVAALNPHAGEGGLLGREEIEEIAPAVEEAKKRGIDARGPYPSDSVFYRATAGEFDAVLAMYHDQGHIAIKMHNFEESTTVNLGLPILRTSVDHGTAYDIAGKGIAHYQGLVKAVESAVQLATKSLRR